MPGGTSWDDVQKADALEVSSLTFRQTTAPGPRNESRVLPTLRLVAGESYGAVVRAGAQIAVTVIVFPGSSV